MTKALAWPVAATAIAALFHREIRGLLGKLKKGKWGSAELEFEQAAKGAQVKSEALNLPQPKEATLPTTDQAAADPRSVIIRGWLELEAAIKELGTATGNYNSLQQLLFEDASALVRKLRQTGVLEDGLVRLYNDLRSLRHRAAHERDFAPDPESVLTFVSVAKELEAEVRRILASKSAPG